MTTDFPTIKWIKERPEELRGPCRFPRRGFAL